MIFRTTKSPYFGIVLTSTILVAFPELIGLLFDRLEFAGPFGVGAHEVKILLARQPLLHARLAVWIKCSGPLRRLERNRVHRARPSAGTIAQPTTQAVGGS